MCSGKHKGKQIARPPLLRLALLVKTNLLSNCMLLYQVGMMNSHWLGNMEPNRTLNVCVALCSWDSVWDLNVKTWFYLGPNWIHKRTGMNFVCQWAWGLAIFFISEVIFLHLLLAETPMCCEGFLTAFCIKKLSN